MIDCLIIIFGVDVIYVVFGEDFIVLVVVVCFVDVFKLYYLFFELFGVWG